MEAFLVYGAALAIAYYIMKAIFVIVAVVSIFCAVIVFYIVNDVIRMLRLRKARREQR